MRRCRIEFIHFNKLLKILNFRDQRLRKFVRKFSNVVTIFVVQKSYKKFCDDINLINDELMMILNLDSNFNFNWYDFDIMMKYK